MPEMSTGQAIKKALSLCLDNYEEAFLAGEDIGIYGGAFGVTDGLLEQYGENRVKDTPISEDVIAGLGVGAAITGMRPIVEMQFSDFIVNAMDPIVNQAAKLHFMYGGSVDVPLIVRGASGGGTGPQNAYDLLLASFVDRNPIIFMEHKLIYKIKEEVETNDFPKDSSLLGKGKIVSEGSDITVVSYSNMVNTVKEAIKDKQLEKYSVELIDLMTLSPLDVDLVISSVNKTGRLLMCQEASGDSSVGSTVVTRVVSSDAFKKIKTPPKLLSGLHSPMPSAKHLENKVIPQKDDIINSIIEIIENE
jgi:pyruvate dehydrogenase E1 component beta subunit